MAILRVEFAVIGVQLCSSMTATFLQRHFLIKLNGRSLFLSFVFVFYFSHYNYFSFLDVTGGDDFKTKPLLLVFQATG